MSIEERITNLESRLDNLQLSFIQAQKNSVEVTAKADEGKQANIKVAEITPYKESKTAYYGEIEKSFYGVPDGNLSVFFDNYNGSYNVSRLNDTVTVSFDTLEQSTNITIMIQ